MSNNGYPFGYDNVFSGKPELQWLATIFKLSNALNSHHLIVRDGVFISSYDTPLYYFPIFFSHVYFS